MDSPATPGAAADHPSAADPAARESASPRASPVASASLGAAGGRVDAEEEPSAAQDGGRLRVRLKMLDEHVFELDATPSMTIVAFREQVARVTQVPPPSQRLIYRGKLMKDGAALSTYDVQDGHTVHLVAKRPAPPRTEANSESVDISSAAATSTNASMQTSTAWERSQDRLRHLLNSIERSENDEGDEQEASARARASSGSATLRRRTPSRERDGLSGTERNIARLRDALDNARERSDRLGVTRQPPRLPQFREFFGDLDSTSHSMAAEMGLAPPTAAGTSNRGAAVLDLEHIAQGMMTVRTVLSTVAANAPSELAQSADNDESEGGIAEEPGPQTPPSSPGRAIRGRRRFFVGQWIDVKDTVNQWLECTVMDIANGKVLVHYHGWPTRWDEWLDFDSDRIAAFRTRTLHTMNPRQMSPVPSTRVQDAPRVGMHDVREMVTQLRDLMHEIMPHVDQFAELCEAQAREERDAQEDNGLLYENFDDHASSPSDQRVSATVTEWDRSDEVSEMAHLVAPVFDRVGRLLVDSSHCLDPLLRPELQATSQRQQHRLAVMRGRRSSSGLQRQATAARVRQMEQRDTSLSIRDLIATSPRNPGDSLPPRRSIDVHIHAIVSPASLSSLAGFGRGSGSNLRSTDLPTPREPDHLEFDEAFGIPSVRSSLGGASDGRAILNDEDSDSSDDGSQDQSRIPLLGASRDDNSSGDNRRRRTVEENLDAFLEDDFFGPSFDHESTNRPEAGGGRVLSSSSPSSQYSSIPSPISDYASTLVSGHAIPEIAEAEEREQMHARDHDAAAESLRESSGHTDRRRSDDGEQPRGSSVSSSTSSSAGFPTFLEVMRRTLSGVRNLGLSSHGSRQRGGETSGVTERNLSPSSSSSSSLPPLSPRHATDRLHSDESHTSEMEEDELDQLD